MSRLGEMQASEVIQNTMVASATSDKTSATDSYQRIPLQPLPSNTDQLRLPMIPTMVTISMAGSTNIQEAEQTESDRPNIEERPMDGSGPTTNESGLTSRSSSQSSFLSDLVPTIEEISTLEMLVNTSGLSNENLRPEVIPEARGIPVLPSPVLASPSLTGITDRVRSHAVNNDMMLSDGDFSIVRRHR